MLSHSFLQSPVGKASHIFNLVQEWHGLAQIEDESKPHMYSTEG